MHSKFTYSNQKVHKNPNDFKKKKVKKTST